MAHNVSELSGLQRPPNSLESEAGHCRHVFAFKKLMPYCLLFQGVVKFSVL